MTGPEAPGAAVATQVARLYFDTGLSKVEIGQRLGISRFRVARLLQHARSAGLVRVEYRDTPEADRSLAREVEARFGLDLCAVAGDDGDATARLAAEVVAETIGAAQSVGVAWGSTLAAVVRQLPPRHHPGLRVVPLAGGSAHLERDRGPGELARAFADRAGGGHRDLYAPAFVASPTVHAALVAEPEVAAVVLAWATLDVALVGIGAWSGDGETRSSLIASGALPDGELAALRARGAVGELVVHPFDADGSFVAPDLAARAVAIPISQLRRVPRVIAVAAGRDKATAIRGALKTGIVRTLVTDAAAAAALLEAP